MIDEPAARLALEELHGASVRNLVLALAIEHYLGQVYSLKEIETHYSPATDTMLIEVKNLGDGTLANMAAAIRTAAHQAPKSITYYGDKRLGRSAMRIGFEGGLAVIVRRALATTGLEL